MRVSSAAERLRACVVVQSHPGHLMGGAEYQSHLLATELASRKEVDVTFIAQGLPDEAQARELNYRVLKVGRGGRLRERALFLDSLSLWRALESVRPHLIYQRMKQSYSAVCAAYARHAGVPLYMQIASDFDVDTRWLRRGHTKMAIVDAIEAAAGSWGLRNATHVLVQSERQRQLLRARFKRDADRIVGNFHPLPDALPPKTERPFRVLWVGNMRSVKRPELFADLACRFANEPGIEFIMLGQRGDYEAHPDFVRARSLGATLRLDGAVPIGEVNALMRESHVLVNTSAFEGFPNTFIQAWGRGVVVTSLAVDIDGGLEAQRLGYCAGSVDRLERIIRELVVAPRTREDVGARAFAHVHAQHSLANAARLADEMLESTVFPGLVAVSRQL